MYGELIKAAEEEDGEETVRRVAELSKRSRPGAEQTVRLGEAIAELEGEEYELNDWTEGEEDGGSDGGS